MAVVAIYTRISVDPTGDQSSTVRQEEACRAYALARGWRVSAVYEDVNTSAYEAGVHRPAFEALRAALPAVDGVLVWRVDRLFRRPLDFELFWLECEQTSTFLTSATEPIDTTTDIGVAIVRILVTFAQLESVAKSERLKLAHRQRAQLGDFGRHSAYGHTEGYAAVQPDEAALLREAAMRCLEGEPLDHVVSDFNDRGLRTRVGAYWREKSLRTLLLAPRLAGDHHYMGELLVADRFPAILDRETCDALRDRLVAVGIKPRPRGQPSLLRGWLICGICGSRFTSGGTIYKCSSASCNNTILLRAMDGWAMHHVVWRTQLAAEFDPATEMLDPPPMTRQRWRALNTSLRRDALAAVLTNVVVTVRTSKSKWGTERLRPTWRIDPPGVPEFEWVARSDLRDALESGQWVRTKDASSLCGLTVPRSKLLIASGAMPTMRFGRHLVMDRQAALFAAQHPPVIGRSPRRLASQVRAAHNRGSAVADIALAGCGNSLDRCSRLVGGSKRLSGCVAARIRSWRC